MKNGLIIAVLVSALAATAVLGKPDKVDGLNVPEGRIPQEIQDNR